MIIKYLQNASNKSDILDGRTQDYDRDKMDRVEINSVKESENAYQKQRKAIECIEHIGFVYT